MTGVYGSFERYLSLTDEEVADARSVRDFDPGDPLETIQPREVAQISALEIGKLISDDTHKLVVACEVTSREVYERKYRKPIWPELDSGITIGIGFDIGHHSAADFETAWRQWLPADQFARLAETVGETGDAARGLVQGLSDISIDWQTALNVYHAFTVPKFGRMTANAFPKSIDLHPHCFGALFSLVYNRGPGMKGDRRAHMRNIRGHLIEGRANRVPDEYRDMKSLWSTRHSGLHKRREAEAVLFERGLHERDRERAANMAVAAAAPLSSRPASSLEAFRADDGPVLEAVHSGDGDGARHPEVDFASEAPARIGPEFESNNAWSSVGWVENDDNSPEYAHILEADRALAGCSFEFGGRDLELLIRANSFNPIRTTGKIVFALRGALLAADAAEPDDRLAQIGRTVLKLKEARPTHRQFCCTIGVYDIATGLVSGFIGSTVLNAEAVLHGKRNNGEESNLLPSGCYRYVVGKHKSIEGCLREGEDFTVLRNSNNFSMEISDRWSMGFPADNIHPAASCRYGSAPFSSYGCLVIKGTYGDGTHRGQWGQFRKALGLDGVRNGTAFSTVLLTGLEAAIAYDLRVKGRDGDASAVQQRLGRLRHGSEGDSVVRLQQAINSVKPELNLPADGKFRAKLKLALAAVQAERMGGKADAVYAPKLDALFGLNVMTPPEATAPSALVVASLESARRSASFAPPGLESTRGAGGRGELEGLYHELGRRARAAERDPMSLARESPPPLEGWSDDLAAYGQRVFLRIERSANRLLCGDGAKDATDREELWAKIDTAIKAARSVPSGPTDGSSDAVGSFDPNAPSTRRDGSLPVTPEAIAETATNLLATGIVSSLGVAMPIAAIVAHIIVKQAVLPALHAGREKVHGLGIEVCRYWSDDLDQRERALERPATNA
jgi:hypothetical protein